MEIKEAIHLIELALPEKVQHAQWADLGCGSGTFTIALSHLLGKESKIYAVDKQSQSIHSSTDVEIEFIKADFSNDSLPISNLEGILMANALHYIKDKSAFIEKIKSYLKETGQLIIVEYDTEHANQWVPYPIPFHQLKSLFAEHGFNKIQKTGEYNSIYNSNKMYACVIS
ncbi:MAG: methyltransferase domain-containing protein [Chryseolinea sp.]